MIPLIKIHAISPENIVVMLHVWDTSAWRFAAMTRNNTGDLVCYSEDFSTEELAALALKHAPVELWETKLKEDMKSIKP